MELKPCPFCGTKPRVRIAYSPDRSADMFVVECFQSFKVCGTRPITRWCMSAEEAADAWNRRANDV